MAGCRPPESLPPSSFPSLPSAPAAAATPASGAALIWPGSGAGSSSVPWPLLPPVQPPAAAAPAGTRGVGAVSPVLGVTASSPRPAPSSLVLGASLPAGAEAAGTGAAGAEAGDGPNPSAAAPPGAPPAAAALPRPPTAAPLAPATPHGAPWPEAGAEAAALHAPPPVPAWAASWAAAAAPWAAAAAAAPALAHAGLGAWPPSAPWPCAAT